MISIAVTCFKYKHGLIIYELPKGSSVLDLKTEIQQVEGIPIGHQRLVYNKRLGDLQDYHRLRFPMSLATIHVLPARIYLRLKQRNATKPFNLKHAWKCRDKTIDVSLDLHEPVHILSKLIQRGEKAINISTAKLSLLNSRKRPIVCITDVNQSLSSYGVCNGDTIDIVFESWSAAETVFERFYGFPQPSRGNNVKVVQARYDWDGDIKHPVMKGLPLRRGALINMVPLPDGLELPGWSYGYYRPKPRKPTSPLSLLCRPQKKVNGIEEGFFPNNYVIIPIKVETPLLPPFQFPQAIAGMSRHMPIKSSDTGHSCVKVTVDYKLMSCPTDPTQITVSVLYSLHDLERLSSISTSIIVPDCGLSDVKIRENEDCGKGVRREAWVMGENHEKLYWGVKAQDAELNDVGLVSGEESVTFLLTGKPVELKYSCHVSYTYE